MRVAVTFSLLVPTLPANSIASGETVTRALSPVSVGSLFRAFWIWLSRSASVTPAIALGEVSVDGLPAALELAAPAIPPDGDTLGFAVGSDRCAVPVGFTWPDGFAVEGAGVPALV